MNPAQTLNYFFKLPMISKQFKVFSLIIYASVNDFNVSQPIQMKVQPTSSI